MHRVIARLSVDGRLRVDSEEPELVQRRQMLRDDIRLRRARFVRPWKAIEPASTEGGEQLPDFFVCFGMTPAFECFVFLLEASEHDEDWYSSGIGRTGYLMEIP